ncbi:hypothetical protein C7B61_04320 [filamentous cyanobacterium CCP1]|nr:hypothetical protein C7B76_20420 [filamentous cyanobacterium CCP2]PSB67790.1 hypothetical protein C7B61_04320 [filamentous cyanobacterium CCP1]
METIGLVSYIACTSSYSGGIHLYFPFSFSQNSWELASVVTTLLERSGFALKPGQLELFPDPKPYRVDRVPHLFNAHRLPLQPGSYLLNQDFQPIWTNQDRFVEQWHLVQSRNTIDQPAIKRILRQVKRRHFRISNKADKFINDLNTEIELGWTGSGQTNRLLGRITMRTYIFNHVLEGGEPLKGKVLVEKIVSIARSLPGYREWCRHQHEIEHRVEEWVHCIENSHYFHYSNEKRKDQVLQDSKFEKTVVDLPTWNQQQSESARERIRQAVTDLLKENLFPSGATARFKTLTQCGIGGGSLYRHRDLWHPDSLQEKLCDSEELINTNSNVDEQNVFQYGLNQHRSSPDPIELKATSLFPTVGGNVLIGKGSGDRVVEDSQTTGGNSLSVKHSAPPVRQLLLCDDLCDNLIYSPSEHVARSQLSQAGAAQNKISQNKISQTRVWLHLCLHTACMERLFISVSYVLALTYDLGNQLQHSHHADLSL